MKWLRLSARQYIDTGISPGFDYRVTTTIRLTPQLQNMPIFGSRNSNGSSAFNMYFLGDFPPGATQARYRFRADFGSIGSETALPVTANNTMPGVKSVFSLDFGSTVRVNDMVYNPPSMSTGSNRNIFIGSINSQGSPDANPFRGDIGVFTIYDQNNNIIFNGIPVRRGSTEYSSTPAPSNCLWDTISNRYRQKSGGSGVIWYEDTDDILTESDTSVIQSADYGMKVLAQDSQDLAYMNSKYPLFGADISKNESQFKTYDLTLAGFNDEPSPPYPGYVYDGNFYNGKGRIEKTPLTINTGFRGGSIKSVLIQHSSFEDRNWQARARQITQSSDGTSVNSLLNPSSKTAPGYTNVNNSNLYLVGKGTTVIPILQGQPGSAAWNTLANYNGGSVFAFYDDPPTVRIEIDNDGVLRVRTSVPYNWTQRAASVGSGWWYRSRWCDWAWFQAINISVTVLNTPYRL